MKKMLINALHAEEIRVAVVEDGILAELHIESSLKEQLRGNIYKGRVARVEASLNAVFVEYGREKNGFLPFHDLNPAFIPGAKSAKDAVKGLHKGMEIFVQVNREEKGAKGALLTQDLSLPGRFMVLLPKQDLAGISRKIEDEEKRRRLREIITQLNPPGDVGVIIRTAGMDRTKSELSKDLAYLLRLWKTIEDDFAQAPCPALLYREGDIIIRSIRDYMSADTKEILIDDEDTCGRAMAFMKSVMPAHKKTIRHYKESKPLFLKHELEKQIQAIYDRKVKLKSGGSLVIESTEAMVTIDVNSGKDTASKDIDATALSTNLEAAAEIARQVILRDLGGLIVIDFIDMRQKAAIRKVEKTLKERLKADRAHIKIGKISEFGLLQLSRERLSPPLMEKSHVLCPHCQGAGVIRSMESSSFMALRDIHMHLARNKQRVQVSLPPQVAQYVLNRQRRRLVHLEQEFGTEITILPDESLHHGELNITAAEQAVENALPKG